MLRLIRLIELFPFIYSDYELVFLSTHLPNYHFDYEYQYKGSAPNISNEHYIDLDGFHNFISSLDCIISSKLHPGIAALSCGIPFLWIPGYDKTREFLKSVGLSQFEFTRSKLISMLITKQIKRAVRNYPFDEINRQKAESGGHIKYLKELIESYSA
jgi:polysaccharide pyruvyl transferase WcaK-like protein